MVGHSQKNEAISNVGSGRTLAAVWDGPAQYGAYLEGHALQSRRPLSRYTLDLSLGFTVDTFFRLDGPPLRTSESARG